MNKTCALAAAPSKAISLLALARIQPLPPHIAMLDQQAKGRGAVEAFIRDRFRQAHQANIQDFLPNIVRLQSQGQILATLSLQAAQSGSLFLEQYLDIAIEQACSERLGHPVVRTGIAELGNLAVASPASARWLIIALTAYLRGAGFQHVVFTAIPRIYNSFLRMGLKLTVLAPAKPDRLHNSRSDWGNYFEQKPMVVVGDVAQGFETLQTALWAEGLGRLRGLLGEAHASGRGQFRLRPVAA